MGLNNVDGFLLETPASVGEGNVIVGPVNEPDSQAFFQGFELLAQCGLGDVEAGGGFTEVQFLGQYKESPKLAELHGSS
ncbi:hypothetical protein NtRootA1_23370 [Arthrobacter sp. NtRootA1]|nr:hypothetical protein NtRootA1_23370 [Arthrobacter sp. NtRootA1]